jgi:hypothetical protein
MAGIVCYISLSPGQGQKQEHFFEIHEQNRRIIKYFKDYVV